MTTQTQRVSYLERAGYSAGDAAANFVFMSMILFQTSFYTDVFGISAGATAALLLVGRLWDAVIDPLVGFIADRTNTRWGKYRPWILLTAAPWSLAMILAYTTPVGCSHRMLLLYAVVTNIALMSIYSINNMPYSALGGVITGDPLERDRLNSLRFASVNFAQLVVGGLTLPLVAKFSAGSTPQHGWQVTMTLWAAICFVLFVFTFATTRERVTPPPRQKNSVLEDLRSLARSSPWAVMFVMTIFQFAALAFRGGALYNYYHHYVDKAAMYQCLQALGLTTPGHGIVARALRTLGYIVHGDKNRLSNSNVADVFNSIVNVTTTLTTIVTLSLSPSLSARFGKKAVAVTGFALSTLATAAFAILGPNDVYGMLMLTIVIAACFAPTIPLVWSMYADVADYSEWKTGRRITGVIFATICFALKAGLALGSAGFLWTMTAFYHYDVRHPEAIATVGGFRVCATLVVALLFAVCTGLLLAYKLNRGLTHRMVSDLSARRGLTSPSESAA